MVRKRRSSELRLARIIPVAVVIACTHPIGAAGEDAAIDPVRPPGVAVRVFVDQREVDAFVEAQRAESRLPAYAYRAEIVDDETRLRLDSDEVMGLWKGGDALRADSDVENGWLFESALQFAPVFLLIDVLNEGRVPVAVEEAWLEVVRSETDYDPYLRVLGRYSRTCGSWGFVPEFELNNHGWSSAWESRVSFAFGDRDGPSTRTFTVEVGYIDDDYGARIDLEDELGAAGVDVARMKQGGLPCPSIADAPACAAALGGSGLLGELDGAAFAVGNSLLTRVWGKVEYDWHDYNGNTVRKSSPISVDIPLSNFALDGVPECGAGGPVKRGYASIDLPLDVADVRIPFPFTARLAPRANERVAVSLIAEMSSLHRFAVVLGLSDGTTVRSAPIDLVYFLPRFPRTN